jgi:uncharacterized alkaline shock family protein YloU
VSATASLEPTAPWAAAPEGGAGAADPVLGRGHLRIDARVVQKLAARAANEVDGVTQASVAPIGRAIHHPVPASTPHDQLAIDLDLTVCVEYPRSLRTVVEELAAHVARRVEQLAGRPVGRVRVRVRRLGGDDGSSRPRVR